MLTAFGLFILFGVPVIVVGVGYALVHRSNVHNDYR